MKTKKTSSTYTAQQDAGVYVYPNRLGKHQKKTAAQDLQQARQLSMARMNPGQQLHLQLLSLKFQMEDWATHSVYDPQKTFGAFLEKYASTIQRKNYELASDIGLNITRFSQIVNGRILPSEKIVYRLELHSNHVIPALTWFALLEKDMAHQLRFDTATRKAEYKQVKNILSFDNKAGFVKITNSQVQDWINKSVSLPQANETQAVYAKKSGGQNAPSKSKRLKKTK